MNRFLTFGVALALSFGVPTMVYAQHRDNEREDEQHDRGRGPPQREEHRGGPPEHEEHRGQYFAPRYEPPRGYERHAWQRGEVLPPHHYAERYVVADYGHYGLREPPRGYRWVRVDNDMVLVAIASGVIADVLLNILYN